jgi:hypothetical protein
MRGLQLILPGLLAVLLLAAPTVGALRAVPAIAQEVKPLPAAECNEVRTALEDGLPVGPGFRRMEFEFPPNQMGIKGRICRLLTVGSGAHFEGPEIRTLIDMNAHIKAALTLAGWRETKETKRFTERSVAGRDVFALFKKNSIGVSTILIGMTPGYEPSSDVKKNDNIYLGALNPFEREWWIAIDCFHL